MRDELLNGEIFYTLKEAQIIIESWRRHYNTIRPHGALGYKPPAPEVFVPAMTTLADCARPTGSGGQATRRAEADPALILNSDHLVGQVNFIHHLHVEPRLSRHGVGRALLSALPSWGAVRYRLKCVSDNKFALAFCLANSFAQIRVGHADNYDYILLESMTK